MRYPTIETAQLMRLVQGLISAGECDYTMAVRWQGRGEEFPEDGVAQLAEEVRRELDRIRQEPTRVDPDRVEGEVAGRLYEALGRLPIEVLDDPGFWRYLSIAHFFEYVRWRESGAFEKDYTKFRDYIDGKKPAECVVLRGFLRGRIAAEAGDASLATAVPKATDLWRSHIVRVRTGFSPEIAGSLIREQANRRMVTDELREVAKRLKRMHSNLVLSLYPPDEARVLVSSLRDDQNSDDG